MFKRLLIVFSFVLLVLVNVSAVLADQATADTDQAPTAISQEQLSNSLENVNASLAGLKTQLDSGIADNKLTGEVYFGWSKGLQNSSVLNGFDVQRVYLTYKQKLDSGAALRVTLDVGRLSTAFDTTKKSQNLYGFLKYAYFDLPWNPLAELSMTGRFGLQQTVWIDFVNKIWNHNYITKAFVDSEGVMSSADFGAAVTGKLALSGIPEIEFHGTLLNGSGYKLPEANGAKDVALRLNSDLFSGDIGTVTAGAFANMTNSFTSVQNETQGGILLALKNADKGNIYGEYLFGKKSKDISGFSIGGYYYFLNEWAVIARLDKFDPDTSKANDDINRLVYGVTYDWGKNVQLALDVQNKTVNNATESVLYFQSQVLF